MQALGFVLPGKFFAYFHSSEEKQVLPVSCGGEDSFTNQQESYEYSECINAAFYLN